MTSGWFVDDVPAALRERRFPTVTVWNRVEPRPRSADFSRALRAEVRDALWMLTRQWQLGEFRGDDAGTPVSVRYHLATTRPTRFAPGGDPADTVPVDPTLPLEAAVESRPPAFRIGDEPAALDLRLLMGRQWLRLVPAAARPAFLATYGIAPPDPADEDDVELVSHPEVWATLQAVAGRAMDGYRLWEHLRADPGHHAYDGTGLPAALHPAVDAAADRFLRWFTDLITVTDGTSWVPERLEHRFTLAAPDRGGEKHLTADQFPGGPLDWHAFSVDPAAGDAGAAGDPGVEDTVTRTVLPNPVAYDGMPDPRWWAFEDGRTSFADVRPDTTDLAKLLFTEFALVFSNDWFVVPCELPAGTLATVRGLAVTNVFGERLWIEPASAGDDDDPRRWTLFTLDVAGDETVPADPALFLPPVVPKASEGAPVEEVVLVRDEMANMVWGVERMVPLASGDARRGTETAAESREWRQRLVGPPAAPATPAAPVRYQVMNTVPEQWIPFVPVHVEGSNREIQLQRAALPRLLEGDLRPPRKVRPRTSLLRVGLDATPPAPYFLHEEEVPRAGTSVSLAFRRTRWADGRVVVWLGARRSTGRGEGSSGIAFDSIVPATPPP